MNIARYMVGLAQGEVRSASKSPGFRASRMPEASRATLTNCHGHQRHKPPEKPMDKKAFVEISLAFSLCLCVSG